MQQSYDAIRTWFPTGIELSSSQDPCDKPTGRADITATSVLFPMPILLHSVRYFGLEQFLHRRNDTWPCFKHGVKFAAGGILSNAPSVFLAPQGLCGNDYAISSGAFADGAAYELLHSIFVRTHKAPPLNMQQSWPSCQLFYETNKFMNGQTVDFLADDPTGNTHFVKNSNFDSKN